MVVGRAASIKKYILDQSLERTERKLAKLRAQIPIYEEIEYIDAQLKILENNKRLYQDVKGFT